MTQDDVDIWVESWKHYTKHGVHWDTVNDCWRVLLFNAHVVTVRHNRPAGLFPQCVIQESMLLPHIPITCESELHEKLTALYVLSGLSAE